MKTSPAVAGTSPATIWSSVDLPQPDGPTMETNVPRSTSTSTPSRARVVRPALSYALRMPRTRR